MPKFIGSNIEGAVKIHDNAHSTELAGHVRLSYAQAMILANHSGGTMIVKSLDTTDKGGKGSYAKRWYRWFAYGRDVLDCPTSTPKMRAAAERAMATATMATPIRWAHWDGSVTTIGC